MSQVMLVPLVCPLVPLVCPLVPLVCPLVPLVGPHQIGLQVHLGLLVHPLVRRVHLVGMQVRLAGPLVCYDPLALVGQR